jgi:hypothetical protein
VESLGTWGKGVAKTLKSVLNVKSIYHFPFTVAPEGNVILQLLQTEKE